MKSENPIDISRVDNINSAGQQLGYLGRHAIRGPGYAMWLVTLLTFWRMVRSTVLVDDMVLWQFCWVVLVALLIFRLVIAWRTSRRLQWHRQVLFAMYRRYIRIGLVLLAMAIVLPLYIPMRIGFQRARSEFESASKAFRDGPQVIDRTDRIIGGYSIREIRLWDSAVCFRTARQTMDGSAVWFVHDPTRKVISSNWITVEWEFQGNWFAAWGLLPPDPAPPFPWPYDRSVGHR